MQENMLRLSELTQDMPALFKSIPDPYLILTTSFEIVIASDQYLNLIQRSMEEIRGKGFFDVIDKHYFHNDSKKTFEIKNSLNRVLNTKQDDVINVVLQNSSSQYYKSWAIPVLAENKEVLFIIHKLANTTEPLLAKQNAEDKKTTADEMQADLILNTINDVCYELDQNFDIKYANQYAYHLWNKTPYDIIDKSIWQIYRPRRSTAYSNILSQAYNLKKKIMTEIWCVMSKKWLWINASPSESGLIVLEHDTGDNLQTQEQRGKIQQEIKLDNDLVQSIFDIGLVGISLLQAVRNDDGEIVDFKIMVVNKELENQTGKPDLVNKLYTEEYPGIKQSGLFDLMIKAMETNIPEQMEYYYPCKNFDKWFLSMFVKNGDGLVASNLDITHSKDAEAEKYKNSTIIQQAEKVAQMGSWDYDINTGNFSWSEGMYQLFELPINLKVTPGIYLKYATDDYKQTAVNVIKAITAGTALFEEELEIIVNDKIKCLKIKASVLRDEDEHSLRVIGVDMDVSSTKEIEKQLKSVQDNFYKEIINAQEEERRRVAEMLHNEFGQLLSIAKMKLTDARSETAELLNQAISKVRIISNELMPAILNDYGLDFALKEMVEKKLSDTPIKHSTVIKGLKRRIPAILEVAVYRILQELLNNVIKHSKASLVNLTVDRNDDEIVIKLSDDGIGMDKTEANKIKKAGFGLNYITNRVKLLRGMINIKTGISKGSLITIKLPLLV